jgi:UDP-N-acetylmuramate--alanine ligase
MKHKLRNVFFIGIGGSGMSGIAEVLLNLGFKVSGSDLSASPTTARLEQLGARFCQGHRAENLQDADAVVVSSAVPLDNPERLLANQRGIPIVPRATMLAELMRLRQSIAVAGTHGKTTSTSLIAAILAEAGLDPTYVIGGLLAASGSHARLGKGEYMVVEADESDGSFLSLYPIIAMITNIDRDHLEHYRHDYIALKRAFIEFAEHVPFYGAVVACMDSPSVREILPFISRPIISYGLHEQANYRASHIRAQGRTMCYTLHRPKHADLEVVVNQPGVHNVQNSLGAFAIADELGIADAFIIKGLAQFRGVGRRSEELGEINLAGGGKALVIEDYGHHPTEIATTYQAIVAAYPSRRVLLVFQPHRYSRTRDCFDEFVKVLGEVTHLLLTDIYSAGEKPIASATGSVLLHAINRQAPTPLMREWVADVQSIPDFIRTHAQDGDIILAMGAGSIGQICRQAINHPTNQDKP